MSARKGAPTCHPSRRYVANGLCKSCYDKTQAKKHVVRRRNYQLVKAYGITLQEYQELFDAQGGRCACCGIHQSLLKKALHVDHDHALDPPNTGNRHAPSYTQNSPAFVRGLLCPRCNYILGYVEKIGLESLFTLVDYLRRYGHR